MAANARFYKVYPIEIAYFTNQIRNVAATGRGFTYAGEFPFNGGITINLKHGVSFSSWGENIRVTLTSQGGQTMVDIYSECVMPTQVVAWGKNQENVQFLFYYLEQGMAAYQQQQQYYQQQQQYYQQPAQPPQVDNQPPQSSRDDRLSEENENYE